MNCPKCNHNVPQSSSFCLNCGEKLSADVLTETPILDMPTAPPKNKKSKKTIKLVALILSILALVTTIIFVTIFVIMPMIKYNKAVSLMEEGKYYEAYEKMVENAGYSGYDGALAAECLQKGVIQLVEEEKPEQAFDFYTRYGGILELTQQITVSDQKSFYDGIGDILNRKNFLAEIDTFNANLVLFMLAQLPSDYEDVEALTEFFYEISSNSYIHINGNKYSASSPLINEDYVYEYLINNKKLTASLWKYDSIRQLAENNILAHLTGIWKSQDGFASLEFTTTQKIHSDYYENKYSNYYIPDYIVSYSTTFTSRGLEIPDKLHDSFDVNGMILSYYLSGFTKVCDVFKFELNKDNPFELNVYCYADGKTITLYRGY